MELDYILINLEKHMKEIGKTIKKMVKVFIHIKTEFNMTVNGKEIKEMVQVN